MQPTLEKAHAARQNRLQARGHQPLQQLDAAAFPPCEEANQQRQNRQRPEPQRRAECQRLGKQGVHGSLLHTVCASSVCTSSRPAPAARNHGKRSRY